jgi:ferritin-like metal-binding protein YciE
MRTAKPKTPAKNTLKRSASNGAVTTAKKRSNSASATKTNSNTQEATLAEPGEESLLEKLFINLLKDIYWAEQHLVPHLQTMQQHATTEDLQDAFEDHAMQTQKHVSRLEKVFRLIGRSAEAKKCDAMEGLTKEAVSIMNETEEGTMTRDAALIIAAQKVEHYEIASYGSLVQLALTLGHYRVAEILEMTLVEEEDTDSMLTDIAETCVNPLADNETEEDHEEETEESEEEEL